MQGFQHHWGISIKGGLARWWRQRRSTWGVLTPLDFLPWRDVVGCCWAVALTLSATFVTLVLEEDALAPWAPLDEGALHPVTTTLTDWPCTGTRWGWTWGVALEDDCRCSQDQGELGPRTAEDTEEDLVEAWAGPCCCSRDEAILSPERVAVVDGEQRKSQLNVPF